MPPPLDFYENPMLSCWSGPKLAAFGFRAHGRSSISFPPGGWAIHIQKKGGFVRPATAEEGGTNLYMLGMKHRSTGPRVEGTTHDGRCTGPASECRCNSLTSPHVLSFQVPSKLPLCVDTSEMRCTALIFGHAWSSFFFALWFSEIKFKSGE